MMVRVHWTLETPVNELPMVTDIPDEMVKENKDEEVLAWIADEVKQLITFRINDVEEVDDNAAASSGDGR